MEPIQDRTRREPSAPIDCWHLQLVGHPADSSDNRDDFEPRIEGTALSVRAEVLAAMKALDATPFQFLILHSYLQLSPSAFAMGLEGGWTEAGVEAAWGKLLEFLRPLISETDYQALTAPPRPMPGTGALMPEGWRPPEWPSM